METEQVESPADGGAVSMAPVELAEPAGPPATEPVPDPEDRELDWTPRSLDEGLPETVEWLLDDIGGRRRRKRQTPAEPATAEAAAVAAGADSAEDAS